jgi:hypothetical protein
VPGARALGTAGASAAMTWFHRLEHWLGWNRGNVVAATDERGTVWIGFRCTTCGKVSGIHAMHPPPPERFT